MPVRETYNATILTKIIFSPVPVIEFESVDGDFIKLKTANKTGFEEHD